MANEMEDIITEPIYAVTETPPNHVRMIFYQKIKEKLAPPSVIRETAEPQPSTSQEPVADRNEAFSQTPRLRDLRRHYYNNVHDFYSMYQEDDLVRMPMWKSYLYHLQQQAPKPKKIFCQREVPNKPPFYGREFHGAMSREDADFLLTIGGDGSFLIRESQRAPGQYTLAIRFQDVTKNFKLYYDSQHYVGEKRFDNIQDLVADGLITFYLESKAADYIAALSKESNYAESPYVAYNTFKKRQLAHPGRQTRNRSGHGSRSSSGVASSSTALPASTSSTGGARTESSGRGESGRESGHSSSGSGGDRDVRAVTRGSRANIPVTSQFVEKRRSQAEASAGSSQQGAVLPHPTPAPRLSKMEKPEGKSSQPSMKQALTTMTGSDGYQQIIPMSQLSAIGAEGVIPEVPEPSTSSATPGQTPVLGQHYYQNSEQIALHQRRMEERQKQTEIPPPPDEPPPRPPPLSSATGTPQHIPPSSTAESHTVTENGVSAVDGRVSHATNTDGPSQVSTATTSTTTTTTTTTSSVPGTPSPLRQTPTSTLSGRSNSRSPSPRNKSRKNSKKAQNNKMFENFSTPPGSPPPHQGDPPGGDLKPSSVSWCTDFMEVMGCEKPHNFKLHTFKGPHWCDYCANFLWGLIAQGVKCQDCGLNAHKKCSERVPNDCMPDMKYVKRMFGIDLTTLVKAQNTLIPAVVELCVKEIESRGIDAEGLYRVAGFHDDVEAIKMSFDKEGEMTDISTDGYEDINTITSVLKLYFRLLPIPLVTFEIYFRVIDTVRREDINLDVKLEKLKHMLAQLPPAHYHTLKYLMAHLHRVTEQQSKNMMNAENLAIVFAPTALRSPETDPLSSLSAVRYERELIEMMINHHNTLFD